MRPDHFNAFFEFFGSVFLWLNVARLYKDKKLSGVRILPTAFFSAWGIWNLYYYPSLNQWWSFAAGLSVAVVNITWVCLAIYYARKK